MPNKDPTFLQIMLIAITESPATHGAIMAFIVAILRILYDEKKTKPTRIILEALICGTLSLCVTSLIEIFNLPESASITIGGAIGFIGVTALRNIILKIINKRIDK